MAEQNNLELEQVEPSEFYLEIAGKKRQIKFGNLALAKMEKKYGSISDIDKLQKDIEEHPMETMPWLLSISMRDKEGIGEDAESILAALDDSDLNVKQVMDVIGAAMNKSMSAMIGTEEKN
jgi:hypothetical protein